MREKAGIDERDRDASSGEALIRIETKWRRQHVIRLFKNDVMRIDLRLRAVEKLDAVYANARQLSRAVGICLEQRRRVSGQIAKGYSLNICSSTEVTGQVCFFRRFGDFARDY